MICALHAQEPSMTPGFDESALRARFELTESGETAFADYSRSGDQLVITHVESPLALRGKGTAGRLMQAIPEHARQQQLRIVPLCGYARAWLRRHPEWND